MNTIKEMQFVDIFKNSLKIIPRTLAVKTLLSERNLRRIDYKPYYQRNYVWDNEKQTFFIESVLLGTEIPPLILFKSGGKIEVIDGRQRFETLKKFKENELTLGAKGLMALPALKKQTFNKLDDELKEVFMSSNIRVFEFEILSKVTPDVEDKVKKEIFRRYNTGITPLTSVEVDGAKYDDDLFSNKIEEELEKDKSWYERMRMCFFPNEKENTDLKSKMVDLLRREYILPRFPISKYAQSSSRSEIIGLLYNTATANIEDIDSEYHNYRECINDVLYLHQKMANNPLLAKNKLIYETMLWALCILNQEGIVYCIVDCEARIAKHYINNIMKYSDDDSYFYKNILDRFIDTANLFYELYNYNFDIYIRNSDFSTELQNMRQKDSDVKNVVQQLENLRINKPSPVSKPVEEILSDVLSNKYLIRPSYQRQEKISISKAASIIESILLGISLPPIFIYKRKNGVKEVIDGQQRLLSIIAFIGNEYRDENGNLTYSKNNNFKLKKLKVLTNLNGLNYSSLSDADQDKIQDFVIDEIVIEEALNAGFDPTDLFIRLNQKPYPIQQNSFEMWNSTVDKDVIQKIKCITQQHCSWFYSKENVGGDNRTDRMENEELITLLSYLYYAMDNETYDKVLGTFKRIGRITCRVKDKNTITDYLLKLEDNTIEKNKFLSYIDKTSKLIEVFGSMFETNKSKDTLNSFFNVKKSKTFRRSYQDFYIVWIILHSIDIQLFNKELVKSNIYEMLCLLRNVDNKEVNEEYYNNFITKLNSIITNKNKSFYN